MYITCDLKIIITHNYDNCKAAVNLKVSYTSPFLSSKTYHTH